MTAQRPLLDSRHEQGGIASRRCGDRGGFVLSLVDSQQNLHLGSAFAVPPVLCRLYRPSGLVREELPQVTIERSIPLVPTDEKRPLHSKPLGWGMMT